MITLFRAIKEVFYFVSDYEIVENGLDQEAGYVYFMTRDPLPQCIIDVLGKFGWISYSPFYFIWDNRPLFPAEVNNV